jgi:hypothetical protein
LAGDSGAGIGGAGSRRNTWVRCCLRQRGWSRYRQRKNGHAQYFFHDISSEITSGKPYPSDGKPKNVYASHTFLRVLK